MPSGVELKNGRDLYAPLNNLYGSKAEAEIVFNADMFDGGRLEFII